MVAPAATDVTNREVGALSKVSRMPMMSPKAINSVNRSYSPQNIGDMALV